MVKVTLGNAQTVRLYRQVVKDKDAAELLRKLFDGGYYTRRHPEAGRLGVPLLWHYLFIGFRRGFDPSALFDTKYYLETHPDVVAAQVNPLMHYLACGRAERRDCRPPAEVHG
jgi:hypothetical protein